MNFMTPRVLAIDVGIWNFSFALVRRSQTKDRSYVIEKWENHSLPDLAGYPGCRDRISGNAISMTLLSDITFAALARCFPANWVRHNVDHVWIESQPRFGGKAGKVAELSSTIYNYFQALTLPDQLCCWKFPDVQMVGAGTKFDGGVFFDLVADDILPMSLKRGWNLEPKCLTSYKKRKNYAQVLVHAILTHATSRVIIEGTSGDSYHSAFKKDDYCDALILAAVAMRKR
jgi:hypothetical protein